MRRIVPKLSASLLIVDRADGEPRFLFGRRHANHVFMPNRYVFPGGRVDTADTVISTPLLLRNADQLVIDKHLNARNRTKGALAIAQCAIREAWEESGHLIAKPGGNDTAHARWSGSTDAKNLAPDLSALRVIARAITPAPYPRRYDAWFFMTFREAIAHTIDVCGPESELDHQIWASEAETRAFDLPSITRMVLREAVERLEQDPDLNKTVPIPMFSTRGEKTSRRALIA